MNHWLQRRMFTCPKCQVNYTHDLGYQHKLFLCPKPDKPTTMEVKGLSPAEAIASVLSEGYGPARSAKAVWTS